MSELTGQNSRDLVEIEEIASKGIQMAKPLPTEWTDEKHRLYLSSMEASFVKQLYNLEYCSTDLLDWSSRGRNKLDLNSSRQLNADTQFKVLRGGSWKKLNFERARPRLDIADETHALTGNQWIQRFSSGGKRREVISPSLQENCAPHSQAGHLRGQKMESCGVATSSKHFSSSHYRLCHHDSVGSNTEVSDQNFDNEDYEGEQLSSSCNAKRMKTELADDSSKDQVVPIGKSPITANPDEKCASLETEAGIISDGQS
ncbi:hypothetical protein BVC80_1825g63 [Macleaya cordata]|uniref:Cold regulated protein n=1 Tax=Macleaya cordata TaxID=56857 RepID=A0A200QZE8_MACCD|nr:hypothetical protein BVC80_1825g63 [Macleaya cordata]